MKCSAACRYYQVSMTDQGAKVWCDIYDLYIREIKNKLPEIYCDCPNFKTLEVNK